MNRALFGFIVFLASFQLDAQSKDITVSSPGGSFVGTTDNNLNKFFGIPYAQPPVGELRWRPSQALGNASRPLANARDYGPICPQPQRALNKGMPQSEDCLTLNIWSPDVNPNTPAPVMVWIHGGSFKSGSNRWPVAEASKLAAQGVVVVSINYRLGLLGRFSHPALTAEQTDEPIANFGLMDQVVALRWVQDNIAAFGGDADNVTIFGYSAGAVSVNFLMALPSAKGLFLRGISQSSAVLIPQSRHMLKEIPGQPSLESAGDRVAKKLGLGSDATTSELRALSVEKILSYRLPPGSLNPVVDGGFVKEDLAATFARGELNAKSYMIGLDSWEDSLAKPMHAMPGKMYLNLMTKAHGFDADDVATVYQEKPDAYAIADALFADGFHASSLWLAQQAQAAGLDTYLYWFSYLPPEADKLPGVPHGGEVPYVFGNLENRDRIGKPKTTETDRAFAQKIQTYWTAFSRTGNPNHAGLPNWKTLGKTNSWMILDETSEMKNNLMQERMALWLKRYNAEIQPSTESTGADN